LESDSNFWSPVGNSEFATIIKVKKLVSDPNFSNSCSDPPVDAAQDGESIDPNLDALLESLGWNRLPG